MKNITLVFVLFVITISNLRSQTPQKISYQCIVRNSNNNLIVNQSIGIRISIVENTFNGNPVYIERHNSTSNSNGLVSLEIGSGIVESGNFSLIDWSQNTYFIKSETDLSGGNNYSIIGTSQILSVPYALHAKTVENITELDPLFINHPSFTINNNSISNWNESYSWGNHANQGYLTIFNESDPIFNGVFKLNSSTNNQLIKYNASTGKWENWTPNFLNTEVDGSITNEIQDLMLINNKLQITNNNTASEIDLSQYISDGSETHIVAGSNVSISGNGTIVNPYIINSSSSAVSNHYIGELYGGGIVFWVSPNGNNGLIMSLEDLNTGIAWSNITNLNVVYANDIHDGLNNSIAITEQPGHTTSAAKICLDYVYNGFDDWYLPSTWELSKIYENSYEINNVLKNDNNTATIPLISNQTWSTIPYPAYWSSTEDNNTFAYYLKITFGNTAISKGTKLRVRAIRKF